jgi:thiamine kinase-like enzyme
MIRERIDPSVESFLTGLKDLEDRIKRQDTQADVIIHGDAHFANALFSPEPRACLIDWGMPMIGFGEIDLAHALAMNLSQNLRREWEQEMVGIYLDQMAACGSPIEKSVFYERYRLGVLYSFVSPIIWWRFGVPEPLWQSALTNSLDAARDLGLLK